MIIAASQMDMDGGQYQYARFGWSANPVGNGAQPTREMAPMQATALPTVMHPRLNTTPWSTSYGQMRAEPRSVKSGRKKVKVNKK